ncbi:hypothetical protein JW978_01335 [Candidatus Dojkabacteria bacterium]|nr:hypothetical protein [Candidatus Dojkabacteria bacterium]
MKDSKLQVTIETKVKERGEKAAQEMGFSSLQELIRVFIANLDRSDYQVGFTPIRQATEEEERGIAASMDDIRKGRYKILKSEEDIDKYFDELRDSNNS